MVIQSVVSYNDSNIYLFNVIIDCVTIINHKMRQKFDGFGSECANSINLVT